ncbi:hypothetical protein GF325_10860 [Candidatus Bathyarchaeota archaeon]|nr:hypothetical protein [Candidatus Bathyarchaeota archaeon]
MAENDTTTVASLVSLDSPITIPDEVKARLKKNALMVIPDSGKKISLFPTPHDSVVRVSLELRSKGLSPLFFNEIGRITKEELNVSILYTTGLCFAEEKCIWDGFFEDKSKFENIDEITQKFKNIEGVNTVNIQIINL